MPITYEIDQVRRLIHTRCTGPTTLQEVVAHFAELVNDPASPASLDVLLDLTEMTAVPDSGQLHVAASVTREARSRIRFDHCAIVTASEATRGLALVWEMFAREAFQASSVFRSTEEARAWLAATKVED